MIQHFCGLYAGERSSELWRIHAKGSGHLLFHSKEAGVSLHVNGVIYGDADLLRLYEKHGLDFLNHVDGMFALALWDSKRARLVLARDRFGMKPLFYTVPKSGGEFAFATDMAPLLQFPGLSKELDPVAIDQFFTTAYIHHPHSVYEHIRKLRPGHFLIAGRGVVEERAYWNLPETFESFTKEEAPERLDTAISDAVKVMLPPEGPLCAFLSGGQDSSTVVYHMLKHGGRPVNTFSVRFKESDYDEGPRALTTAKHLGTDHHEVWVGPEDVSLMPALLAQVGEPFADPSELGNYLMSRAVAAVSPIALCGDGGDEMLGGYEIYTAFQMNRMARHVPDWVRRGILSALNQFPSGFGQPTWYYKAQRFLLACKLSPVDFFTSCRSYIGPSQKKTLYTPEFQAHLGNAIDRSVFDPWQPLFKVKSRDPLRAFQYLDIRTYLIDNNMAKIERMSAANALEVRVPYLNLDLFTTAFRLAAQDRVSGFDTKVLAKKLMRKRLPGSILDAPKRGFAVPLAHWFRGPLRSFVREQLNPERIRKTHIIRPEAVAALIETHENGRANVNRQLWNLICFLTWHDTYVRN